MKYLMVILLSIFLTFPIVAQTDTTATITIHRVWAEYDIGTALVEYHNNSRHTYKRVEIHCTAYDDKKIPIGINYRSFSFVMGTAPELIRPGFTGMVKVPVSLHGIEMASMACRPHVS